MSIDQNSKLSSFRMVGIFAAGAFLIVTFQNCGPGFTTMKSIGTSALVASPIPEPSKKTEVTCASGEENAASLISTCYGRARSSANKFLNLSTYRPQYPLHSDGAEKTRWIYLPPGTKIETTDPDKWVFPLGTVLWKDFSLQGKRIETRRFEKVITATGGQEWNSRTYLWRSDQSDADISADGTSALAGVEYTAQEFTASYSTVRSSACIQCHSPNGEAPLGFSYLQLSHGELGTGLNLQLLKDQDLLSAPPIKADEIAGNSEDKVALGFLHSNCGSCHRADGSASFSVSLNHISGATSLADENAYKSAVTLNKLIAGSPDASSLVTRLQAGSMPPTYVAPTKTPPAAAIAQLRNWILNL